MSATSSATSCAAASRIPQSGFLPQLSASPTSLSFLFSSPNGQLQLSRLLKAIPELLRAVQTQAAWDDQKVQTLEHDFAALQQAQFKSRNTKTASRAIDPTALGRIQNALGEIQQNTPVATLQQHGLSIDWFTSLQHAILDEASSTLVGIVQRHKEAFEQWLTTLAGLDDKNFNNNERLLCCTPNLLHQSNEIANPLFLSLLVKDTKAFSRLCHEIGATDAQVIKEALTNAKLSIPQTLKDKVHSGLEGIFNLALYSAVARFLLPSLDTPYTPSLGNWYMAGISGVCYMALKHAKCGGNDPIRYELEQLAKKCELEWATTSLKNGWTAVKEVKDGVVAFAEGVPFLGKALSSPKWATSITVAYLARQQLNTSLWTTSAIACAWPAWNGSFGARVAAGLLLAYDWHIVSATIPIVTTTLSTAGSALNVVGWAANKLHETNSTVAYVVATALVSGGGRYLYKNLNLRTNVPHALAKAKAALTMLMSDNPIEVGKKALADLWSTVPTVDNKTASTVATPSQAVPSIFSRLDQKSVLNTVLSPIQKMMDLPYNAVGTLVAPATRTEAAVNKLFKDAGIDPNLMAPVSSLLSYIEAVLNWAGKIPVISVLSGSLRSTLGFGVIATSTITGVALIALSALGNSSRAKLGIAIVREGFLNGGSNLFRGFIESSSWSLSLMVTTPWDLCGKRFSYLKETPAKLHIPFILGVQSPRTA